MIYQSGTYDDVKMVIASHKCFVCKRLRHTLSGNVLQSMDGNWQAWVHLREMQWDIWRRRYLGTTARPRHRGSFGSFSSPISYTPATKKPAPDHHWAAKVRKLLSFAMPHKKRWPYKKIKQSAEAIEMTLNICQEDLKLFYKVKFNSYNLKLLKGKHVRPVKFDSLREGAEATRDQFSQFKSLMPGKAKQS